MPFVNEYVMPLSQHAGGAEQARGGSGRAGGARPGDRRAGGFVSTTLPQPGHPVRCARSARATNPSGKLIDAIEIEADPFATQRLVETPATDWQSLSDDDFLRHVQHAGLVGMGGAAFSHPRQIQAPRGQAITRLIANGCECEPYLTADHRTMVERPRRRLRAASRS